MTQLPVVSVPGGAHSAKKALAKQLNYLMGFDEVVLMFDGDEAGARPPRVLDSFPTSCLRFSRLLQGRLRGLTGRRREAIRQSIWNKRSYVLSRSSTVGTCSISYHNPSRSGCRLPLR